MQESWPGRSGSPSGGFITIGTLILAAASAIFLVLMSGCHVAPVDQAAPARLHPYEQACDGLFELPADDTATG